MDWLADTDTWEPKSAATNADQLYIDRYILAKFYYETNGPNGWVNNDGWLSTSSVCNWHTNQPDLWLSCDGDTEEFAVLNLGENNIIGSLPTELGLMTSLRFLRLHNNDHVWADPANSGNQLSGPLPTELGKLTRLETMYLGNVAGLSGSIPTQLGLLTTLNTLLLNDNNFSSGIPTELGSMTSLTYLRLDHNNLNGYVPPLPESLTSYYCNLASSHGMEKNCFNFGSLSYGRAQNCYVSGNCNYT